MNEDTPKYKNLLDRARELKEAAVKNATNQLLEDTADEHRKLIYEKLNRKANKELNENIYGDEEETALDRLLHADSTSAPTDTPAPAMDPMAPATDVSGAAPITDPMAPATDPMAPAGVTPDAGTTIDGTADVSNDVNVDALNVTGEEPVVDGATEGMEEIDPKEVLELTPEDINDLDPAKLKELMVVLMNAYQDQKITVPESGDSEVSMEIPENPDGTENPENANMDVGDGLQGDTGGELDSMLAGEQPSPDAGSDIDNILNRTEDEKDDEQDELNLESVLRKRQNQLHETLRRKNSVMGENADILLQNNDMDEEIEISLEEEVDIMANNKLNSLKDKVRREIEILTEGRSEKTLNETKKNTRRLTDTPSTELSEEKLREQNKLLRHERDTYSRRLKSVRKDLQEKDEKLDELTNYTLRFGTLQKLFTNNPICRQMNEAQKEVVIDIVESVKDLPLGEAQEKLEEIYNDFQEETKLLTESRNEDPKSKRINENRKRPGRDAKPILDSKTYSKENGVKEEENIFESADVLRMLEIANIDNDNDEDETKPKESK